MSIKNSLKRTVAAFGSATLLALGMFVAAPSAVADPANGPDQTGTPDVGSVTITKIDGVEQADRRDDGTQLDADTVRGLGDPLEGVEFTYYQVGIQDGGQCVAFDPKDTDHWEHMPTGAAPAAIAEFPDGNLCLLNTQGTATDATGSDGVTRVDLDLGLYYFVETKAPDNVTKQTAPFYVSVPMPNEDNTPGAGDEWLYDIYVYPKNLTVDAPVKVINTTQEQNDAGRLKVGETVQYTITQKIPEVPLGETRTQASIFDTFVNEDIEYLDTVSVFAGATELQDGTHYNVNTEAGTNAGTTTVTWELTDDGLALLNADENLVVTFNATVNKVTETGEIANKPYEGDDPKTPGYGSSFNNTPKPGNPTPYTYWGELKVNKVDREGNTLAGAQFEVHPLNADGQCVAEPTTNAIATGTSNDQGVVLWDDEETLGLFVANSNDGPLTEPTAEYCLIETQAPAGYTAGQPQTVTITAGTVETVAANEVAVTNVEKDVPNLPLTGAQGTALLTILGLGLVGAGAGAVVISRRRQEVR